MVAAKEVDSSLHKLSVNTKSLNPSAGSKKKQPVADSWEDEDKDSGDDTDRPLTPQPSNRYPNAPPPTPSSPSTGLDERSLFAHPIGMVEDRSHDMRNKRQDLRPQKTDATAMRMIAGALGVNPPKKTEEQREYEKVIKGNEIKRREQEKSLAIKAKAEAEKAKAAVWGD